MHMLVIHALYPRSDLMTKTVYCRNKNVQTIKLKLYKACAKYYYLLFKKIVTSRHTVPQTTLLIS